METNNWLALDWGKIQFYKLIKKWLINVNVSNWGRASTSISVRNVTDDWTREQVRLG